MGPPTRGDAGDHLTLTHLGNQGGRTGDYLPMRKNLRCVTSILLVSGFLLVACSSGGGEGDGAGDSASSSAGDNSLSLTTDDAALRDAAEAYCADRTEGPGPDIPQLKAAGDLSADWDGEVDVVLNPPTGEANGCGDGAWTYAFWTPTRSEYPITVTGCNGTESTLDAVPSRALSVDQISYQLALELGLTDSIYGFWPTRTDDLPADLRPLKVENQEVNPVPFGIDSDASEFEAPGMGDNVDHSEQILAFGPDFLFSGDWFGWPMAFGWDGPVPMEEDAAEIAPTYMGFTNNGWVCEATGDGGFDENAGWSVGSADAPPQLTFERLYADIRTLGIVFDVQDRAFEVVRDLKDQVTSAIATAGDRGDGLRATTMLVGFGDTVPASWDADNAQYYSRRDPINAVMTQLGMSNVWARDENVADLATVESFVAKNPDVIIMQSVYPDCRDVRDFITEDPTWQQAEVPAVIDDRMVCTPFRDTYLGLGLPEVLTEVADQLAAG